MGQEYILFSRRGKLTPRTASQLFGVVFVASILSKAPYVYAQNGTAASRAFIICAEQNSNPSGTKRRDLDRRYPVHAIRVKPRNLATAKCPKKSMRRIKFSELLTAQDIINIFKQSEEKIIDITDIAKFKGDKGDPGAPGPKGNDGGLKVWGDGSGGDKRVSNSQTFNGDNPQFDSFEISNGATFRVFSNTTIRSSGSCIINGTIEVITGASGGRTSMIGAHTIFPSVIPPSQGIGKSVAGHGEFGSGAVYGGISGPGLEPQEILNITKLSQVSIGAAGAGGCNGGQGGAGGGGLALYCKEGIFIGPNGKIVANGGDGTSGGGGGSGGVVILASEASVVNTGTLEAQGGKGGSSSYSCGAGGGGSGGVIRLIAPIVEKGWNLLAGGAAGSNSGASVGSSNRMGGSAGGSLGAEGGNGGIVMHDGTPGLPSQAQPGQTSETLADPTALLM